jgi:Ca2+-binding EF-hand superfamily protein
MNTSAPRTRRLLPWITGALVLVAIPTAAQQLMDEAEGRGQQRFDELDTDDSGTLSEDEMLAGPMGHFEDADTNDDGQVTTLEFVALATGTGGQLQPRMVARFNFADTDADGTLTEQELISTVASMFQRIDADQDGEATPDEARDGFHAMREEYRAEHGRGERGGHGRGPGGGAGRGF